MTDLETTRSAGGSGPEVLLLALVCINIAKVAVFGCLVSHATPFQALYKLLVSLLMVTAFILPLTLLRVRWPVVVAWVVQSAFIAANLLSFFAFGRFLKLGQYLALLHEGTALAANAAIPWDPRALVALVDLPLLALWLHWGGGTLLRPRIRRFLWVVPPSAAVGLAVVFGWMTMRGESIHFLLNDPWSGESRVVKRYGVLISNVLDAYVLLDERRLLSGLRPGPVLSSAGSPGRHQDFLLLQVESLDANIVDEVHDGAYIMPFLHGLSRNCVYEPYTLTYHDAGGSSDAEFAVLNGMEPLPAFPTLKLRNYSFPNSLVRPLVAAAYEALAFHGNFGSFFNRDVAYSVMGFDAFLDRVAMGLPEAGWGASDASLLRFVEGRLRRQEAPFLYYVITMSSHEPYELVNGYYRAPRFDDVSDSRCRDYFTSMSYVDEQLRAFIGGLGSLRDTTYVVIFGDHSLMVDTPGFRPAKYTIDGQRMEFVPLLVLTPRRRVSMDEARVASLMDVLPTVLETSGVPFAIHAAGGNLLSFPASPVPLWFQGRSHDRRRVRQAIDEAERRAH